jgi:hypothetical protein
MPASPYVSSTTEARGTTFARWKRARRYLIASIVVVAAATTWLVVDTIRVRFARDVARLVFNDNTEALEQSRLEAGVADDSLQRALSSLPDTPPRDKPVIIVSIAEKRLWYKQGDSVLFTTQVATGSGKELIIRGSSRVQRFETPRGRFLVQRRDSAPAWIPPDWHFVEQANKRKLGLVQLTRATPLKLKSGDELAVVGNDVVRRSIDGTVTPLTAADGREIVADGRIVIPPFGTNQRRYGEVLGTHRLYLGDGYALHGTNQPNSIGQAVSHGCVRLRNLDIARLYESVTVGTPVFIY